MNKEQAFLEINKLQDDYVEELIQKIHSSEYLNMKTINFTSPTGTGKTKMMAKFINRLPDYFYIVTTLSKGQLNHQVRENLMKDCDNNNFIVYGNADYRINSILKANDILSRIPKGRECIWLRDEGHIRTNRFEELLAERCYKVINFSATNVHSDIQCNFTQTMMLRTVNQTTGTPEQAICKLIEIKKMHEKVQGYNPCAIFRCISTHLEEEDDSNKSVYSRIINLCEKYNLKYIDITDNNNYIMSELCEDNNEYDVIINKFKIVEGIDIRRSHVLYMDNQPLNNATTIQAIGRCRRNALLYRDDIDILLPENDELLKATRECYVYYNVEKMKVATDENGELQYAFCNYVSCQELKADTTIDVINGQLSNGLYVIELEGETGQFNIIKDEKTGFNKILEKISFYENEYKINTHNLISIADDDYIYSIRVPDINSLYFETTEKFYSYDKCTNLTRGVAPYIKIRDLMYNGNVDIVNKTKNYRSGRRTALHYYHYDTYDIRYKKDIVYSIWGTMTRRLLDKLSNNSYKSYTKIWNDVESSIVGTDIMKQIDNNSWIESKPISSKIGCFCKLNEFISNKYSTELSCGKLQLFNGKNHFNLDKKCNSVLGYAVEYYSKYLIYGKDYLEDFIEAALHESYTKKVNDGIIVRACLLAYKHNMMQVFGHTVSKLIRTISVDKLIQDDYVYFVNLVKSLGQQTADFVRNTLYPNTQPTNDIDPNLSIKHISGLADYITEDTILDIKVTNNITNNHIKQVLGYYYLSTKRSDLHINRVIVYDAVSNKSVTINISKEIFIEDENKKQELLYERKEEQVDNNESTISADLELVM